MCQGLKFCMFEFIDLTVHVTDTDTVQTSYLDLALPLCVGTNIHSVIPYNAVCYVSLYMCSV